MLSRPEAGLFFDPGLGKTRTVLTALKILRTPRNKGKIWARRTLVVAPLRVAQEVWRQEAAKWQTGLRVELLHGKDKDDALDRDADVYVINPEGLDWLSKRRSVEAGYFDVLVVDESSKFKETRTQRFKILRSMLRHFKRRYILTGSPAPKGLMNLFGQIYILDGGDALGKFITHYRAMYFTPDFFGHDWRLNEGAEEKIYAKIRPLVLRKDATDHLDMPELPVIPPILIDLPTAARAKYDELRDELVLKLSGDKHVVASSAAVLTNKLRQVANGAIYHSEVKSCRECFRTPCTCNKQLGWTKIHDAKLDALDDLIEELEGNPAIVAYEFRHDLERLMARYPGTPHLGGGVSAADFSLACHQWNAGLLPLLFVQPQSVAHGLNLQEGAGHTLIWFGITWSYEDYDQLIRRLWRQGQRAKRVLNYQIIARQTVDERMMAVLRKDKRTQQDLLDALKEECGL